MSCAVATGSLSSSLLVCWTRCISNLHYHGTGPFLAFFPQCWPSLELLCIIYCVVCTSEATCKVTRWILRGFPVADFGKVRFCCRPSDSDACSPPFPWSVLLFGYSYVLRKLCWWSEPLCTEGVRCAWKVIDCLTMHFRLTGGCTKLQQQQK